MTCSTSGAVAPPQQCEKVTAPTTSVWARYSRPGALAAVGVTAWGGRAVGVVTAFGAAAPGVATMAVGTTVPLALAGGGSGRADLLGASDVVGAQAASSSDDATAAAPPTKC